MKRIVKLHLQKDKVTEFIELFKESKPKILSFEGCNHVELLQGVNEDFIVFTYSFWDNELALNAYRNSNTFKGIWSRTKLLFDGKPEAWSVEEIA